MAVQPAGQSADDSLLFAEHYIRNWAEDILLYEKALNNIPDSDEIEKLVHNYRKALIMHTYQQALIHQKLSEEISEEELQAYVDNLKFKSLMATQEIEFSTAANPVHSAFDIIGLYKDDLTGIYEETEWSFSFTPGEPMTHRARRAIFQ